ncbi:LacI family DNA-binding transcriptional regulator [Inconstantimicrobium mannanitabidum]|uniref:LacI family transcriptional regulator n=1 Tax=Inconstantimicrobium mannanitabidum TaxID=1604901 RepID=A0ACB5RDQ6_9CLOT|nr:LacI family DNA-binding transcriptional regulator [Clostridium sp. TW13]GKX67270.1 LacI family transcriptional regulator [Clostridium sp. TW13]
MKIKDIADLAGVAPSTVSRVINNSGYVSEDLRKKIELVIEQTGYIPNNIAKSLKTKRTNTIGVIIPQVRSETVSKVVDGITQECNNRDYDLILANTNLSIEEELSYLKILQTKQLDGIIFMCTEITERHKDILEKVNIPIVIIGQEIQGFQCIIHDDFSAAKKLTNLLIDNNHKDIAFINVDKEDIAVKYERYYGFMEAMKEHNLKISEKWIEYGDFSIESGVNAMEKIWNKSQTRKPTAVFSVNDNMALGAISYLKNIGVNVPEQCSIVGIGNNKLSRFIEPALTTVEYYQEEVGKVAAICLLNKIEETDDINTNQYISYDIVERNSVKKLI